MFLPISTDAPLYHRPWGTIGVIVANCVAFWVTGFGDVTDGWVIQSGHLAPAEWITAAFFHFSFLHLLGNMIFLWMFGMIVEGKLGFGKFLLLYLVLCVFKGCATQLLLLGEVGHSAGGASGVIYALMAISLVWAPKNEIEVIWIWFIGIMGYPVRQFSVTVFWFAMWYVGTDLFFSILLEFRMSTPVLHSLGAMVGFPVGVLMLKRGWVDCEGWDLFSVRRGEHLVNDGIESFRYRGTPELLARQIKREQRRQRKPEREVREIQHLVLNDRHMSAWSRYEELRRSFPSARLDELPLRRLIDGLHRLEEWPALVQLLTEYIGRFPERAPRARLMLAAILVQQLNRPLAARRAVRPLRSDQLSGDQQRHLQAIRSLVNQKIAEGVIELRDLTPAL